MVGVLMLAGLYGSFYCQLRHLSSPPIKTLFLGLLLFMMVRGLGDTERFDLSFPLWSIALISLMLAQSEDVLRDGRLRCAPAFTQPSPQKLTPSSVREAGRR